MLHPAARTAPQPSRGSHGFKRNIVCGMVTISVCLRCPHDQIHSRNLTGPRLCCSATALLCGDSDRPPHHPSSSAPGLEVVPVKLRCSKATLPPFMNNKHYFVGKDFDTVKYPQTLNLLIRYLFQHGLMVSSFIQRYCFLYFDVRFAPDLTTRSPFKLASVAL